MTNEVAPMIDAAFLRDPYPAYEALRQQGPIHWSTEFCGGAWLLTDYADVMHVLRDSAFATQRASGWANTASGPDAKEQLAPFKRILSRALLFLDGADHARLRQVMNAGFKPAQLAAMRLRIGTITHELIDELQQSGEGDFIKRFARHLPARTIAAMLGVDTADQAMFFRWSNDVAAFIGEPTPSMAVALKAQESLVALSDYFAALLPARRRCPRDDLVSQLAAAERQGLVTDTPELLAQCCTLLFGGHETTRNLLASGLYLFLRDPACWRQLREQRDLLGPAVREVLRYESPVQYTGRKVKQDTELHGAMLREGDLVIALIGAANRDPQRFTMPERFDIRRNEGSHLAFGTGLHVCIGAALTYMEAEIAFDALLRRVPDIALLDAGPCWGSNAVYRSLTTLNVCLQPDQKSQLSSALNAETEIRA